MSGPVNPVTRSSDLPLRAASGVAAIIVALGCVVAGGYPFLILMTLAALMMAAEWGGLMMASTQRIALLMLGTAAVAFAPIAPHISGAPELHVIVAAGVSVAVMVFGRSIRLGLGVLYAALPLLALTFLRREADGIALTLWTLAIVWATDIGAYFAGRAIGGPKLAPRLSPNKTWAGLIGGMVAALAVGYAIAAATSVPWQLASLAGLLAVAAQAGDLFESWLKRRAGVKDSGRLLPGHGGALDRLDGLVPVAIIVALLVAGGYV